MEVKVTVSDEVPLHKKSQDEIIQQLVFDVSYLKVMVDLLRADIENTILVEEKQS